MQELSKKSKDNNHLLHVPLLILSGTFMIALTIVCFMAPVLQAFDNWMERKLIHGVYVFIGLLAVLFVVFAWLKFKK